MGCKSFQVAAMQSNVLVVTGISRPGFWFQQYWPLDVLRIMGMELMVYTIKCTQIYVW